MPDFTYVVIDNAGKQKKGNIQAANEEEAKGKLKSDGLMIVNIEKASMMTKEINISFGSAVKPRDLSVFCSAVRIFTEITVHHSLKHCA